MLFRYRTGELSEPDADPITEHVSSCAACQAVLGTFSDAEDTFAARLRRPAEVDPYADEPEKALFLARALELVGAAGGGAATGQAPAWQPLGGIVPSTEPADLGRLGEYQLLAKLGEGGMGAVYKARQIRLKKIVALKVLPKQRTNDPSAVARFEQEMEAVGRVTHPNIVQALDARDIDGTTVLVMEYVEGQNLSHIVRQLGMLPIAEACEVARQTALGLQAAHDHGLVHRDIKPSNLMLTIPPSPSGRRAEGEGTSCEGIVKILDLGLARLGTEKRDGLELTFSGAAMGTADYMAPEQASDAHTVDARADIYSLGCTLHKLLTGHAPFSDRKHPTEMNKMLAHLTEPMPPIRGLRADVPEALAGIIDRMLAKRPEDRISTAAEVAAAMAPFAAGCNLARISAEAAASAGCVVAGEKSLAGTDPHASSAVVGTDADGARLPSPVRGRGAGGEGGWYRRRIGVRGIIATTLGLSAIVILGAIITVATRKGTLEIETDDPNVQVAVKHNGEVVDVVDAKSGWKISLKSGEYELAMQGSTDQLRLDKNSVVVKRGDTVKVTVTLKRADSPLPPGEGQGVRVADVTPLPAVGSPIGPDGRRNLPPGTVTLSRSSETLVRIQSQPPQAQVSVDERILGVTPLASGGLKPGFHQLIVSKDGFIPLTVSVFLGPGQTVDIGMVQLAKTPASIEIWRVGSPRDNDVPPSLVPAHLGMLAKNLGIELKVRSLNASAFRAEFEKALRQPDKGALPDVVGGRNFLPFEALLSEEETCLLRTHGVLESTGDCVFLVRNSSGHIAARALALLNTNEIWRRDRTATGWHRTAVETGTLPGQLISDADRNALTDANSKAVYSYLTNDTDALASLSHPKTLLNQGAFGGSAHNIRVGALRHACFLGNARLAFVVCRVASWADESILGTIQLVSVWVKTDKMWKLLTITNDPATLETALSDWPRIAQSFVNSDDRRISPASLVSPIDGVYPEPTLGERFGAFLWKPSTSD